MKSPREDNGEGDWVEAQCVVISCLMCMHYCYVNHNNSHLLMYPLKSGVLHALQSLKQPHELNIIRFRDEETAQKSSVIC